MKKILMIFLAINCVFLSCRKNCNSDIPTCIQERIEQIKKLPTWNPPAEIHEYIYNGQKVYLVSADCCDQYELLLDKNCNTICAPRGGFTGKGDGKCADFDANAKHVRLVWKDDRK